ncbi:phthioceranic/hydroxyphthioceranic acid synthase-like [Branchiostoma lanceolatum]|uniref:phthioceranic/hydroxyphthioceranic acid synthase-like n=1 Tax=Branchiostoma lanceolatum TaxID=7740 RepID=UPI003452D11F
MAFPAEDSIAIVGLWCRFPHADSPDDFWKVLINGEDCMEEIPPDRWSQDAWYSPDKNTPGKIFVQRAGFVQGYKLFDPSLFGLRDEEASRMDPQQRFMLECSYKAFENAGITMEELHGSDTGVFVGLMSTEYQTDGDIDLTQTTSHSITGTASSLVAARVSYTFNLTGPALTVDTACSSGLYAVHLGCQAINTGDCSMAVCGGVSFILRPNMFVSLCRAGMASPDGRCKPFSAAADGYARGEGCGVVVLKKLSKALENNDRIWGVIHTGVNQDGRTTIPITAPSQSQQEKLLRNIFEHYKFDPHHIDFIEAHGTGTPVGDPVEANSLGNVIGKARKADDGPVLLGSVKGNIGHLESAAGLAGLIKVLLMMKHKKIVPNVHFDRPNPNIDFDNLRLYVPTEVLDWTLRGKDRRLACVNSFGFGGSNSHALVEHFPQYDDDSPDNTNKEQGKMHIVAVSARKRESLRLSVEDLITYLEQNPDTSIERLAYTSTVRRTHHNFRIAVSGGSVEDIKRSLENAVAGIGGLVRTRTIRRKSGRGDGSEPDKRVIFVFGGQGTLWEGVCLDLMDKEPVFKKKLTEVDGLLRPYVEWSLLDKLSNKEEFHVPIVAQAIIFATQVALFALWQSWGITPDTILGHSVGEVAAAHCSGSLSLPEAVRVIYHRGRLQNEVTGGKMLVVGNLPVKKVLDMCSNVSGKVGLAAENSASSCTLSGDDDAVDELHAILRKTNENEMTGQLFLRELDVQAAYHSHHMEPIREELELVLRDLRGQPPSIETYSTVTGKRATRTDFVTGEYWERNVRQPVMFRSAMSEALHREKQNIVVEVGPKAALRSNIKQIASEVMLTYVASIKPNQEHPSILRSLCDLYQAGLMPTWDAFFAKGMYTPTDVPRYQFDRKPLWFETEKALARRQGRDLGSGFTHPFLAHVSASPPLYKCSISKQRSPYLYDHVFDDTVVVPGAHYFELGLAACIQVITPRQPVSNCSTRVEYLTPVTVGAQGGTIDISIALEHDEDLRQVHFEERTERALHARGTVTYGQEKQQTIGSLDVDDVRHRCNNTISHDDLYSKIETTGFYYGPTLSRLHECRYGDGPGGKEAIALIDVHDIVANKMHSCCIHPAIHDCLLQVHFLLGMDTAQKAAGRRGSFLPVSIESVVVAKPPEQQMWVYAKQSRRTAETMTSNGVIVGMDGQVILELRGLTFRAWREGSPSSFEDMIYTTGWTGHPSDWKGKIGPELITKTCQLKCLVLEDECGIMDHIKPLVSSESVFIPLRDIKGIDYVNDEQALQKMLRASNVNLADVDVVLHCCGVSLLEAQTTDTESLDARIQLACASLRQLIKMAIANGETVPLKIVTRNVQFSMWQEMPWSLLNDKSSVSLIDLAGTPLWGLVRCAIREAAYPSLQLVELSTGDHREAHTLLHELVAGELKSYTEIMFVQSSKYFLEIQSSTLHAETAIHRTNRGEVGCRLKIQTTDTMKPFKLHAVYEGNLEQTLAGADNSVIVNVQQFHVHPESLYPVTRESEDGIVVHWSANNNQDWDLLGLDFVGTVTKAPEKCKLRVGDLVVGIYPAVASSMVSLPASVVHKLADLPVLRDTPCLSYFVLAWEVLVNQLHIKPKQRIVVIDGQTESVKTKVIAAVASALRATCEMMTSTDGHTGTMEKAYDVGIVVGSRKLSRSQLAGVIATDGRVVYICGQMSDKERSGTKSLWIRSDVMLMEINTGAVFQEANLKVAMPKVFKWLSHSLPQHTRITLPVTNAHLLPSLLHKGEAENDGNVADESLHVVRLDGPDLPVICTRQTLFRKDASYIIVGGLTGLGFLTVRFLAERGAGHIAIMSRSHPKQDVAAELKALEDTLGTKILCLQSDVSSYDSVKCALAELQTSLPNIPLKGIFHSAVVISDGILINQDHAQFQRGMGAKVSGTWNLHLATRHLNLDYFVGFSSVSSVLGNGGQTSYGAANAVLDGIVHLRRQLGLSGQVINWGALQLGLLERDTKVAKFLEQRGILQIDKDSICKSLETCLVANPAQILVVHLDRPKFRQFLQGLPDFKRLESVLGGPAESYPDDDALVTSVTVGNLSKMDKRAQQKSLGDFTRLIFVKLLGAEDETVNMYTSVVNVGMDSQLALNAQSIFKKQLNVDVPVVVLLSQESTVQSISDVVYNQLKETITESGPIAPPRRHRNRPTKFRSKRMISFNDQDGHQEILPTEDVLKSVGHLHKLFEKQVFRTPSHTAIITSNSIISYSQLNQSVQHLATALVELKHGGRNAQVMNTGGFSGMSMSAVSMTLIAAMRFKSTLKGSHENVGVCLSSSEEAPCVILAIWKAGYTFVPLCLQEEAEQLQQFVRSCDLQVIVVDQETRSNLLTKLGSFSGHIVTVPLVQTGMDGNKCTTSPLMPARKAFVMRDTHSNKQGTVSGNHVGLLNRLTWMWDNLPVRANDVGCLTSPLTSIEALYEMFMSLLVGSPLLILPESTVNDPVKLLSALERHRVTRVGGIRGEVWDDILHQVQSQSGHDLHLTHLLQPVPAADESLASRLKMVLPDTQLTVMLSSLHAYSAVLYTQDPQENNPNDDNIPSLALVHKTAAHVLDEQGRCLGPNQVGELFISAPGLLNTDRVVTDQDGGAGTGDDVVGTGLQAWWREDGTIQLQGESELTNKAPSGGQESVIQADHERCMMDMKRGASFIKKTAKNAEHKRFVRLHLDPSNPTHAAISWGPSKQLQTGSLPVREITGTHTVESTLVVSTAKRTYYFKTTDVEKLELWTDGLQHLQAMMLVDTGPQKV